MGKEDELYETFSMLSGFGYVMGGRLTLRLK